MFYHRVYPNLDLILRIYSKRLLARFDYYIFFVTSSLFLSILVTSFSIGTVIHPAYDVVATSQLGLI